MGPGVKRCKKQKSKVFTGRKKICHFGCQASYSIALISREAESKIEPVRAQAEAIFRNIKP